MTDHPSRVPFLLSQLGSVAADRFAAGARDAGVSPSEAGVLRLVGRQPGSSQREVARSAGVVPSRMVPLVDGLEDRGLLARERSATDRRTYALRLTPAGSAVLAALGGVARGLDDELTAALSSDDRDLLTGLLSRMVDGLGLDRDLHR
ncbi:MarR family winged helix-turn-helix transcriptional regulator [Tersicoccus sp. Bi-70]|uniref:MarR family winged helix-turn-helix transcriptional regulator n=1 Tax=Tersicoccus sp. Bi-70 TaxID=1897634 RepID=UPI000976B51D|nr:MarR family transcriptional regulator [Tersicoccus sp. Bi-70]OMH31432.1 hypothetical protein BGP79_10545 [Tersicoccus sp. Bi-70]